VLLSTDEALRAHPYPLGFPTMSACLHYGEPLTDGAPTQWLSASCSIERDAGTRPRAETAQEAEEALRLTGSMGLGTPT